MSQEQFLTPIERIAIAAEVLKELKENSELPDEGGSDEDSGLFDIETGEWTPESDVNKPTIPFANQHDKTPVFIAFQCVENENKETLSTQWGMYYFDYYQFFNSVLPQSYNANGYVIVSYVYRDRSTSNLTVQNSMLVDSPSNPVSALPQFPRFYTSENEFYPNTGSRQDDRFWKAGFPHKWIALWLK